MKRFKTIIAIVLSVLLGLVFLYSGYSKLLPVIETFEFTFVDIGVANWYVAPVIARLLIGLEFFTGILLICCYRLRKVTLPLTIFLLVFFSLYLLMLIITTGNSGNCGCFGEHLKMTPLEGILKNVAMLGVAILVYVFYGGWQLKKNVLFLSILIAPAFALPFIINPVDYNYTSNNLEEKVNYPLGLEKLYSNEDSAKVQRPTVELRQGKHVLAFLSLSCSHCRIAAKKFRIINKNNPNLPVYFLLNGDSTGYKKFIADTRAENIPSSFCNGKTFVQLAGTQLPRIYYVDNGVVVKKVDYLELSQYDVEDWLNESTATSP